jgi:hypothetical protein
LEKLAVKAEVLCAPKGLVTWYSVAVPPVVGELQETLKSPPPSLTAARFCTGPGGRATTGIVGTVVAGVVVATVGATVVGGEVGAAVVGATVVLGARVVVGGRVVAGACVVVVTAGGAVVGGRVVGGVVVVVTGTAVVVVALVVVVTGGVTPRVRENERSGPAPAGPIASTVKLKATPRSSPIAETASEVEGVEEFCPKLVVTR